MIKKYPLALIAFLCFVMSTYGQTTIAIQDFDGSTPTWNYTPNPTENSASCIANGDIWNVVSSLGNITIPNSTGNFWGGQDLNGASGCGTSGLGTIDFASINVSGYNNVVISFDYEVDGFNFGADELGYIATFDSSPQAEVFICDGCNQQDLEGTININVPNGTNTVSLQIRTRFDGGSDYFGVDNFSISGTPVCTPTQTITSFSPSTGPVGTELTITGTGFTVGSTVSFSGLNATILSQSATEIVVEVPDGFANSTITVTDTQPCSVESNTSFSIIQGINTSCQGNVSATDLFISEITDSTVGAMSYIEIFNATGSPVSLNGYTIDVLQNGASAVPERGSYTLALDPSFTLNNNETYVISIGSVSSPDYTDPGANTCDIDIMGNPVGNGELADQVTGNSGINVETNNNDFIRLINPSGTRIDEFGVYEDRRWMESTGITGDRGFNFRRLATASPLPNPNFDINNYLNEWEENDWTGSGISSCNDNDYSDIGSFSSGAPPVYISQSSVNINSCDTSVDLTVNGSEGVSGGPVLAYAWFYLAPGTSNWIEITSNGGPYTNFNQATLTISLTDAIDVSEYQYYCQIREDSATCFTLSEAFKIDTTRTVWDGTTWSNGIPDSSTLTVINGNYNTSVNGNIEACSLIINAGNQVNVADNTYIRVQNDVLVNGVTTDANVFELTVQSRGSFVQVADSGTFTSNLGATTRVLKNTSLLNNWYDYTYWSSPVIGETVQDAFPETPADRRYWFDSSNYNDAFYETDNDNTMQAGAGVDDIDDEGDDWTEASGAFSTMIEGVGYAATYNPNPPPPATYPLIGTATFTGPFNTGDITPEIIINSVVGDNDWNLIGNPYPGAIDFIAFHGYSDSTYNNANLIDGCAYLWSHSTPPDADTNGNENLNFSQNDYAIITTGSGCLAGGSGVIPDTYIPSGQSFFVKGLNNGDLVFKNAFRSTANNAQFFEVNNTTSLDSDNNIDPNRLWLNLTSDNGIFNQILVAYVEGATNGFDGFSYDATRNISTGVQAIIYTEIENIELKKFAIQGKNISSLTTDEVIPVGFKTSIEEATIFTFSLEQFEGSFLEGNTIFIKDNYENSVHNLKESDYNFTSAVGEFNDRFEIVFNDDTLSIIDNNLNPNSLTIIEHTSNKIEFKISNNLQISSIEIIDLNGKSIYKFNVEEGASTIYDLSALSQAAYIAKVQLDDGRTLIKKAIKQK